MVEHDTICKKGLYALYYAFYIKRLWQIRVFLR